MPRTMHWRPNAAAPSAMSCGVRTAGEFTLTFSAPASSTACICSSERMPPPTAKGMKTSAATARTTSSMMPRRSADAVMS